MSDKFRYYQLEADQAIHDELQIAYKCIVKMFCGTGKSLLMRYCRVAQNKPLVVYVFPSLSLIDQFYSDYLTDISPSHKIKISSDNNESSTDITSIQQFLKKKCDHKIICITYQSLNTLLNNIGDYVINVCIFDEAHHVVGEEIQKSIFAMTGVKQIFFTATPKNDNGIIMCDKENPDTNMCGKLVYDYSYLTGMNEGYLNPFEIRVDFYTENTNMSIYDSIARAILISGNSRVLTFHADVNTDRETTVSKFVNKQLFIDAFRRVCSNEFPSKAKQYKDIEMVAFDASIPIRNRKEMLKKFDKTPDGKVFIISSCETMGEGIDTKNANMCVFVDPKSSMVKIIQNIGRIVRKQKDVWKPASTILIPCWVDKTKYLECDGDREKCDAVIREDMSKTGNFNGILNVLSALKQEDDELYDICLHYPDVFSPQELNNNANKQGFTIGEEPMELVESLEHLLDTDIECDYEDESKEELLERVAEENDVCIEVHTNSLEEPVKKYGNSENVIRMMKTYDEEEDVEQYYPMMKKDGTKKNKDHFEKPKRENRIRLDVHTNPDIQVLWNVVDGMDLSKEICSCVIDCEVVEYDPMEVAVGIVERAKERERNGGNLLPREIYKKIRLTPELEQENKDAHKLGRYKKAIKGIGKVKLLLEICEYLDKELIGWRTSKDDKRLQEIYKIVERAQNREQKGYNLIPMHSNIDKQQYCDAKFIQKIKSGDVHCSDEIKTYLDLHLPGWNLQLDEKSLIFVKKIVERANNRKQNGGELLPKNRYFTINNIEVFKNLPKYEQIDIEQEHKDNKKLSRYRQALKGFGRSKFTKEIKDYLDINMPEWNIDAWKETLLELKIFIDTHKKRPSNKDKDENIKYLGSFLTSYKSKFMNGKLKKYSEENYILFKEFYEDEKYNKYIQDRTEIINTKWETDLSDLKQFINDNYKLPSPYSNNIKEKTLGNFITNKQRNYKSKSEGMKDDKKYNDWTQFIEEYKKYFNDYQTEDTATPKSKPKSKSKKSMEYIPASPPEPSETPEQHKQRVKSELSTLHQHYKTLNSANLHAEFQSNPQEWHSYHAISEQNEQTFPEHEIPRNRVIQELNKIKCKRAKTVVDMGCGKAHISQHFASDTRFSFVNYDHVACNSNVQQCDIATIPLEDDSVEICILSLAMWGHNCKDYVKEAHRILETGGKLYIIEATKRWTTDESDPADRLKNLLIEYGFRIDNSSIRKFCLFECSK